MEITLDPNGWHKKLQKFVFGIHTPQFYNFCPYFWLTIFCFLFVFIIPIVPLVKFLVWGFTKLSSGFESFFEWYDEKYCKPVFDRKIAEMSMDDIAFGWFFGFKKYSERDGVHDIDDVDDYLFYSELYSDKYKQLSNGKYKHIEVMQKKLEVWKQKNPNWQQLLSDYNKKQLAKKEEIKAMWAKEAEERSLQLQKAELRAEKRKVNRQKFFSFIATYTKYPFYLLLGYLACLLLKCLWFVGVYAYEHFYYDKFLTVMKWIGGGIALATVVILIIYAIVQLASRIRCNVCLPKCTLCTKMGSFFNWMGKGVVIGMVGMGDFFVFMWNGLMAMKKEYCPGINWKEKE